MVTQFRSSSVYLIEVEGNLPDREYPGILDCGLRSCDSTVLSKGFSIL